MTDEAAPKNMLMTAFDTYKETEEAKDMMSLIPVTKPSAILFMAFSAGWNARRDRNLPQSADRTTNLRKTADFMKQASGVDPTFLREAADEIDRLRSDDARKQASAWRVWWVSHNTARTELFEDHAVAIQKATETAGCVIPLYTAADTELRWNAKEVADTVTDVIGGMKAKGVIFSAEDIAQWEFAIAEAAVRVETAEAHLARIVSACDPTNWDADLNKGDYFRGLRDAYEAIHNIASEHQPQERAMPTELDPEIKYQSLLNEFTQQQALLREALVDLRHARKFITTREKMHPTGIGLYDELVEKIEAVLPAGGNI